MKGTGLGVVGDIKLENHCYSWSVFSLPRKTGIKKVKMTSWMTKSIIQIRTLLRVREVLLKTKSG